MLFNESILVQGVRDRGRRVYASDLAACVVDDGVPSDSIEGHLSALCDQYTFFVRTADWPDAKPPQIGDVVRRDGEPTRKFVVTRVARLGDCFSLNCRSR